MLYLVLDALERLLPVIAFVHWFAFACKKGDGVRMKTPTECPLLERAFRRLGEHEVDKRDPIESKSHAVADFQSTLRMCSHVSDRQCGVLLQCSTSILIQHR
jgi:hypothetical protein